MRLIDADALHKEMYARLYTDHTSEGEILDIIDNAPTIDVVRPRGEWVWKEYDPDYDCGDIVCSNCSVVIYEGVPQAKLKSVRWPFCPDCGSDNRKREGDSDA